MEPSEERAAAAAFDAGLNKVEEHRIWIEERAKQLLADGVDLMGMAYEVDAIYILGHILNLLHSKSMFELDEYVHTETLKYCFEVAEREAKDAGF